MLHGNFPQGSSWQHAWDHWAQEFQDQERQEGQDWQEGQKGIQEEGKFLSQVGPRMLEAWNPERPDTKALLLRTENLLPVTVNLFCTRAMTFPCFQRRPTPTRPKTTRVCIATRCVPRPVTQPSKCSLSTRPTTSRRFRERDQGQQAKYLWKLLGHMRLGTWQSPVPVLMLSDLRTVSGGVNRTGSVAECALWAM